ncbi:DUF4258 domain-containing protein [Geothermobacter hydrogeniphilus]|uniref:Uncharacterized protein n=1 Tax=Geothermobacter hydrogeniphilus TaxID=1969733 RepID=A0A1X0Y833_9BACT|nr:DUF4258 domain-containing protein [Geothermobacter hydrogeniphilus]ORJ61318.1 hypothetical protein B5V00_06715 [Geothermobacter hydrogeniphilus]
MVALTMHAANRALERNIPFEAVEACRMVAPILNDKPLRFRYRDLVIVARMADSTPRIISVWRAE